MTRVYLFGYDRGRGFDLLLPGGRSAWREVRGGPLDPMGDGSILDGGFAPRRARPGTITAADLAGPGGICWAAQRPADRQRTYSQSGECPQGLYLLHRWQGFTLLAWWDRTQGDARGACSTTLLVEGDLDASAMLAELAARFPAVLDNLRRAGVELRPAVS